MNDEYEKYRDFNSRFCDNLPRIGSIPQENAMPGEDKLIAGVKKYSRSKRSNEICPDPSLAGCFKLSKNHTGRDLLCTLTEIVNDRNKFVIGNYFYFTMGENPKTPAIALLANPTKLQPGNGVIFSNAADNCQPNSWNFLMNWLTWTKSSQFTRFFKKFMQESIEIEGPPPFTEIATLLLFEIARRRVRDAYNDNSHKRMLDAIPVASCIAICLGEEIDDIRECRDVFGHRRHKKYPKKCQIREDAARALLERIDGDTEYRQIMEDLFSPDIKDLRYLFGNLGLGFHCSYKPAYAL